MSMCSTALLLLSLISSAQGVVAEPELTLPVINAKFDFAASDGVQATSSWASFKARSKRVRDNIAKDIQVLTQFEGIVTRKVEEALAKASLRSHKSVSLLATKSVAEVLPKVEVSLMSPEHPLPSIEADIGTLDADREAAQLALMDQVHTASRQALAKASTDIRSIAEQFARSFGATSFLQRPVRSMVPVARIHVQKASQPEMSVNRKIRTMETATAAQEKQFLQQVVLEFGEVAGVAIKEFEAQLHTPSLRSIKATNFLETLTHEADVQIVLADAHYPTVESLVSAMGKRRASSVNLVEQKIQLEKLMLIQSMSAVASKAMKQAMHQ